MFEGVFTALITPFKAGQIDFDSLKKLINWQLEQGVDGFVINGTTAESPTLSAAEVGEIWKSVKSWVPKEFPLLLGTGSNSTAQTIANTKEALSLGASGALVVVPYYNKPTQLGLFKHFTKVAESVPGLPIVLYNVPGRTVISMTAETTISLSQIENIVGIKEASGDMGTGKEIVEKTSGDFLVTSGDDKSCVELMSLGGKGVISVISHIIPEELKEVSVLIREGDKSALPAYEKYSQLNMLLSCEPNPTPVKRALFEMGIIDSPELRLPLVEMTDVNAKKLKSCLNELGVV